MIDSIEALEAIYGLPHERAVRKQIGFLNEDYQAMVQVSPLVIVSSVGADGIDGSPRGELSRPSVPTELTITSGDRRTIA